MFHEKQFLNSIFENLESISSEQPDITYDNLCDRLGTPKDLIIEYYENADMEYIISKMRFASVIRNTVITILLIAATVAAIELYSFHRLYVRAQNSIDGYSIETAPEELSE